MLLDNGKSCLDAYLGSHTSQIDWSFAVIKDIISINKDCKKDNMKMLGFRALSGQITD